ncbi:tyrosine--tRNA ligase [Candidatus Dojkabacteria bacterium]|jgi:tyrosyl-tRNA synthetase|nr:tyrosine--tRNA ligase [Candidatus Dojkabacteria bacterium]NLB12082.1 tyrosine--tRNA ligase [Candidatus Dojkabacteria bacterium]
MNMKVKTDKEIIERILTKGVEQILPSKEALRKLLESGKRIRIYQGFDPTANSLHIGHAAHLHKLEDFRELGHDVICVIGDFTARIGDPDKKSVRKPLTKEDVEENMQSFKEQIGKILDIDNKENPVQFRYNSEWLEELKFADILELASNFSVQQMLKRDMFQKRIEENRPIYIHEFMYPIMQAYDSVVLDTDIQLGGNDQLFNILAGRHLMSMLKNKEKIVMTGKLLTASDGTKMGKTEGNMIRMDDTPENIYGKIMAFNDDSILSAFEILTFATMDEVKKYQERLDSGENAMNLKKELAFRVTSEITSEKEAERAQKYFESIFQKKEQEVEIPLKKIGEEEIALNELLVKINFAVSKSEAKRLVEQGAVKINDKKATEFNQILAIKNSQPIILKVGKKVCSIAYN